MKKIGALLFAATLAFGYAGMASAHVRVAPDEVAQNAYQVFTIRVPSENEGVKTTEVKLDVPDGVEVSRFEPYPGWSSVIEKNADGKVTAVTWKSDGQGIGETEFVQFNFQGHVAEDAKELVWKAHQTYSDGAVVDWTGAPDADTPASVTAVTAAGGDGHGHGAGSAADKPDGDRDPLTLGLAIAGLVAGLAALAAALLRRRTR
ncbi:YcnI family copper-binding membrane protein [Cohnella sp. 56]|uniref:YcnI family copper-binding membrane protein n=1 Tax=Cohnella sp. 56 TaxID=3113722 RepID=UPI0030E8301F